MDKQVDNKNKVSQKESFNLLSSITLLFPIISWLFIFYYLLFAITEIFNISVIKPFFTKLIYSQNYFDKEKFGTLQNIYTAFFVGFIAAYFTVLSIFLGRKKNLGFKTALKYMLKPNFFCENVYLLLVNFIVVEYHFTFFSCFPISEIYTEFSILQLLVCFAVGVVNMFYMEEPAKAADLLNKFLNKNIDSAISFFVYFKKF